jgi:hypothetical protein
MVEKWRVWLIERLEVVGYDFAALCWGMLDLKVAFGEGGYGC